MKASVVPVVSIIRRTSPGSRTWARFVAVWAGSWSVVVLALTARAACAGYAEDPSGSWTVPTYQSISVYWNSPFAGAALLQYRAPGDHWRNAQDLYYDQSGLSAMKRQYRGSIV